MASLHHALILIILNDPIDYWCDYAKQTIRFLSENNSVVVFCSEDTFSWKDLVRKKFRVSFIEKKKNVLYFHPFFIIPGQRFQCIKLFNYRLNALFFQWHLAKNKKYTKRFFWFFDPIYIPSLIRYFLHYTSVYDCVDYYDDVSETLQKQDRYLLRQATFVFANSHSLKKILKPYRDTIHSVPLGFALDEFKLHARNKQIKRKRNTVGFVGGLTSRIDYRLLLEVAKRLPNVHFVFYGTYGDDARMPDGKLYPDIEVFFSLPNVFWKGSIPKLAVASAIQKFDICIIPYKTRDSFNKYCFPMKVMEYFYMGKPVLSTPIEELKRYRKFIHIGTTSKIWEFYIRQLLSRPWSHQNQREQRKIAEVNSWEEKLTQLTHYIQ